MLAEELVAPMSRDIETRISEPAVFLFNVCGLVDLFGLVSSPADPLLAEAHPTFNRQDDAKSQRWRAALAGSFQQPGFLIAFEATLTRSAYGGPTDTRKRIYNRNFPQVLRGRENG